jgi:hypothetical protein
MVVAGESSRIVPRCRSRIRRDSSFGGRSPTCRIARTRPAELHFFGNPTFGRILSANNPRELQFGVRLAF